MQPELTPKQQRFFNYLEHEITRTGKVVEFIPTAIPWMIVVAGPVLEASMIVPTGDL